MNLLFWRIFEDIFEGIKNLTGQGPGKPDSGDPALSREGWTGQSPEAPVNFSGSVYTSQKLNRREF